MADGSPYSNGQLGLAVCVDFPFWPSCRSFFFPSFLSLSLPFRHLNSTSTLEPPVCATFASPDSTALSRVRLLIRLKSSAHAAAARLAPLQGGPGPPAEAEASWAGQPGRGPGRGRAHEQPLDDRHVQCMQCHSARMAFLQSLWIANSTLRPRLSASQWHAVRRIVQFCSIHTHTAAA